MPLRMMLMLLICGCGLHSQAAEKFVELRMFESRVSQAAIGDFPSDWFERSPGRKTILLITPRLAAVQHWTDQAFQAVEKDKKLAQNFRLATLYTYRIDYESDFPPLDKQPFYLGETPQSRGEDPFGDNPLGPSLRAHKHLWRSLGWLAPDLIIIWTQGEKPSFGIPKAMKMKLVRPLTKLPVEFRTLSDQHLASAVLSADPPPAGTGTIPAIELVAPAGQLAEMTSSILKLLHEAELPEISPAHQELLSRRERTPLEIARQLDAVYGHDLNKVMYQPALSLMARLALDDLLEEQSRHADVERIVADYAAGKKLTLGDKPNGSVTAGHLVFADLAHRVSNEKYLPLVLAAANQVFAEDGTPLDVMPAHSEMSDAVFMGGPILAAAGNLTGEERYYELCLKHIRFMQKLCLRPDGIYRHSPLCEAAWGRGNGFPALGLALALSEIPASHPVHQELKIDLQAHLAALIEHQDPTGMFRQVIDAEGAYREMTATCMITFAMLRGLREGWLAEEEFLPAIEAAWPAIQERISSTGELIDVCAGTGKQKSYQDYFDRPALLGKDERGGAMAFLVVTEYAKWQQEREQKKER